MTSPLRHGYDISTKPITKAMSKSMPKLMPKLIKTQLTLAVLTAVLSSPSYSFDVQGHRGARTVLPENSLPAFEYALEIGVDTLELDTGVSKDGVVVVAHDQKINTTICQYKNGAKAEKDLWLHQLDLEQIKAFDCGSRVNPRFKKQQLIPNTEIPTLREVFELVQTSALPNAKTVLFNIETKSNPRYPKAQPEPTQFAELILELVAEFGLQDRVTIQSFDHRTLLATKEIAPEIGLAALYRDNLSDWVTPTLAAGASIVSPKHTNLTAKEVEAIHAAGLKVIPWTANNEKAWRKLIDMNVDGIITDDPAPLLKMLGRR